MPNLVDLPSVHTVYFQLKLYEVFLSFITAGYLSTWLLWNLDKKINIIGLIL
jgi:hypothetical protein